MDHRSLVAGLSLLLLAGCGAAATPPPAGDGTVEVDLKPAGGSGVEGTATFLEAEEGVGVELIVSGLPEPGTSYLAHVHEGTCGDEEEEAEESEGPTEAGYGATDVPLYPVRTDREGNGLSRTLVKDATLERFFAGGPKHVNVHAAGAGDPPDLACGDLR